MEIGDVPFVVGARGEAGLGAGADGIDAHPVRPEFCRHRQGPALGAAGPTASFSDAFSQPARLVLALWMLIGRLEIFPMLLMFAAPYRAFTDRVR